MTRRTITAICPLILSACTTAWQTQSLQFQPVQTRLAIETAPSALVFIDNRNVGRTPLEVPLDYEREVRIERRGVSYWRTQPGLSLLLSITSAGLYLPFSLIPIDTESRLIETSNFRGNRFEVVFQDGQGNVLGQDTVIPKGEPKLQLTKQWGGNTR